MAERGPLRDGRHLHFAERHTDDGADYQPDGDETIVHDAPVQQGAANGKKHTDLARPDPAAGRGRRTHPLQRKDEEDGCDEIDDLDSKTSAKRHNLGFGARPTLNIFSMRSVIMKPPTTLLVAAMIAIVPSAVARVLF